MQLFENSCNPPLTHYNLNGAKLYLKLNSIY